MPLSVDNNVHTVRRLPLTDGPTLPHLDLEDHRPGPIDLIGSALRDRGWLLVVAAVIGGVVGAFTSSGPVTGVIAGLISGFAVAVTGSIIVGLRLGPHRAARPVRPPAAAIGLRVMEFNVHGGMGGPDRFFATPTTLDHLAATIRAEQPDVVLLQELDDFALRSNGTDTLAELVRRLQPTGAVMTPGAEKIYGRREGTGILTFGGLEITDARGLRVGDPFGDGTRRRARSAVDQWAGVLAGPLRRRLRPVGAVTEYQPRVATDALVRSADGIEIRLVSGHFSSPHDGVDEPARQVGPVVDALAAWAGPTIVGADFNVRDGSAEFAWEHDRFAAAGLAEMTAGAPPNSDRIYASAHFAAVAVRKIDTPTGGTPASDHSPVVVDLVPAADHPTPGLTAPHDKEN